MLHVLELPERTYERDAHGAWWLLDDETGERYIRVPETYQEVLHFADATVAEVVRRRVELAERESLQAQTERARDEAIERLRAENIAQRREIDDLRTLIRTSAENQLRMLAAATKDDDRGCEIERLRAEIERLRAENARLGSFLHPIGALLAAATKDPPQ